MPELPEVETVRSGLAPVMENTVIAGLFVGRPNLRFPFPENFAERLKGQKITALSRRAKYLLADLSSGELLVMHLGMSGSFRVVDGYPTDFSPIFHSDRSKNPQHDHVIFELNNEKAVIYNDPRRFGFMDLIDRAQIDDHPWFAELGPEPLGNALSADYLAGQLRHRNSPVKSTLLDQKVIAGLGNIYVCEALWRARLSPERPSSSIPATTRPGMRISRLLLAIQEVIREAIAAGGSTLQDHRQANGDLGYFQHSFDVYDRAGEDCRREGCGGRISRVVQSGRSSFFCPQCQH